MIAFDRRSDLAHTLCAACEVKALGIRIGIDRDFGGTACHSRPLCMLEQGAADTLPVEFR